VNFRRFAQAPPPSAGFEFFFNGIHRMFENERTKPYGTPMNPRRLKGLASTSGARHTQPDSLRLIAAVTMFRRVFRCSSACSSGAGSRKRSGPKIITISVHVDCVRNAVTAPTNHSPCGRPATLALHQRPINAAPASRNSSFREKTRPIEPADRQQPHQHRPKLIGMYFFRPPIRRMSSVCMR